VSVASLLLAVMK